MSVKKPKNPNRSVKVADQSQRDLTELIMRELKEPRVNMVTIQAVKVSPITPMLKVFFSVLIADSQGMRARTGPVE